MQGQVLILEPKAAARSEDTHAALVVSRGSFSNVRFGGEAMTITQLRTGSPANEWETAWAVFACTDNDHFYYLALKTNGWELGKRDPAYEGGQRFLATGPEHASTPGRVAHFEIVQDGARITVRIDGEPVTTFTDEERSYLSGKIGFYTEDAKVSFDNIEGSIVEPFERYPIQRYGDGDRLGDTWDVAFTGYGYVAIENL
jgi:hypothetical protein